MAQRVCDCGCGESLEGTHPRRRFASDACRKAAKRKPKPPVASGPVSTEIADRLRRELEKLEQLDTYEAQTALGLAAQLDGKVVQGAAYVSLSKELDRRVDALRLKAERPDDPIRLLEHRVDEKRAELRLA